jgi:hypothetical protein
MHICIYGQGVFGTQEGRALLGSVFGLLVGAGGSLACLAWAGWL